jgi:hypothetical protein
MIRKVSERAQSVIIRKHEDHLLLITQPDHAALAGTIMAAWQSEGLPASPRRDLVLFATEHHDDGWQEMDRTPMVAPDGRLLDFITAPDEIRLGVWPRAVARFAERPYIAALIAQHALSIYEPYRGHAVRSAFFAEMRELRDAHLARAQPLTSTELAADYFFVGLGDTISLTFCNNWSEPRRVGRYGVRLAGDRLTVDPDPFGGKAIPLTVAARRIPDRRFAEPEAAAAFRAAPVVTVNAVLSGPVLFPGPRRSTS